MGRLLFLFFTLSISFTASAKFRDEQPKIDRSQALKCEAELYTQLDRYEHRHHRGDDDRLSHWLSLAQSFYFSDLAKGQSEEERADRESVLKASVVRWTKSIATRLDKMGLLKNISEPTRAQDVFLELDREKLEYFFPQIRKLPIPADYRIGMGPAVWVSGTSAALSSKDRRIYLPFSILSGRVSWDDQLALSHEAAHAHLSERRKSFMPRFVFRVLTKGHLKRRVSPHFAGYLDYPFNTEEIVARLYTVALRLRHICHSPGASYDEDLRGDAFEAKQFIEAYLRDVAPAIRKRLLSTEPLTFRQEYGLLRMLGPRDAELDLYLPNEEATNWILMDPENARTAFFEAMLLDDSYLEEIFRQLFPFSAAPAQTDWRPYCQKQATLWQLLRQIGLEPLD